LYLLCSMWRIKPDCFSLKPPKQPYTLSLRLLDCLFVIKTILYQCPPQAGPWACKISESCVRFSSTKMKVASIQLDPTSQSYFHFALGISILSICMACLEPINLICWPQMFVPGVGSKHMVRTRKSLHSQLSRKWDSLPQVQLLPTAANGVKQRNRNQDGLRWLHLLAHLVLLKFGLRG
jgi:hypothetical protein